MPMHNQEIGNILEKVATLLEIEGANQYRVRAYRHAANVVESEAISVAEMVGRGEDLTQFPGIGKDLSGKIREIVETGTLRMLDEIENEVPEDLSSLIGVGGLGPKRIHTLHDELGISSEEDLKNAARNGEIRQLKGFGKKIEDKILDDLSHGPNQEKRMKYIAADEIAKGLVLYLRKLPDIRQIVVAGSYRRKKETIGDLDILVISTDQERAMDHFTSFEDVATVISRGPTRSTVILRSGIQVDLRAVPEVSYGSALHYFTGSRQHDIAVRRLGQARGLKINEYGVFRGKERIAGRTEEEVFNTVGLPYIDPELREDRGEIEAAQNGTLPVLITIDDIRGDLHAHTNATDGHNTLEEMVQAAVDHGYEYIAITNHSPEVTIARGIGKNALLRQLDEIDRLSESFPGITILKSSEVDILKDGRLDYPDDVLEKLDFTVCSIHYHMKLPEKEQTERVIRAMDNPYFTIFAHPTGRLINERKPYDIDLERVMEAARKKGCILELNAHPDRLDLNDIQCKEARDMGVKIAISTDSHSVSGLNYMVLGVNQGRRGWLEKSDVINTLPVHDLKKLFKRR